MSRFGDRRKQPEEFTKRVDAVQKAIREAGNRKHPYNEEYAHITTVYEGEKVYGTYFGFDGILYYLPYTDELMKIEANQKKRGFHSRSDTLTLETGTEWINSMCKERILVGADIGIQLKCYPKDMLRGTRGAMELHNHQLLELDPWNSVDHFLGLKQDNYEAMAQNQVAFFYSCLPHYFAGVIPNDNFDLCYNNGKDTTLDKEWTHHWGTLQVREPTGLALNKERRDQLYADMDFSFQNFQEFQYEVMDKERCLKWIAERLPVEEVEMLKSHEATAPVVKSGLGKLRKAPTGTFKQEEEGYFDWDSEMDDAKGEYCLY